MNNTRKATVRLAFCGMMTALGTALMLCGGLIPIATYCAPLMAGIIILAVMIEYGVKWGWMIWGCTGLLSLLLGADKEAAFFYIFFGYYPLIKPWMEKVKPDIFKLIVKALYFMLMAAIMYGLLCFVLHMQAILEEFAGAGMALNIAFAVLMLFSMLMYDRLLTPLAVLYIKRLRPKLTMLGKNG